MSNENIILPLNMTLYFNFFSKIAAHVNSKINKNFYCVYCMNKDVILGKHEKIKRVSKLYKTKK